MNSPISRSYPPIIATNDLHVIRGDFIDGGTKYLALMRWLPTLHTDHVTYAGSVFGAGGWALAEACHTLGLRATLMISQSRYTPPWAARVAAIADLCWMPPQPVATLHDNAINTYPAAIHLPLGFDDPDFIGHMADIIDATLPTAVPELWVPALSGTLARAVRRARAHLPIHVVTPSRHALPIAGTTQHLTPEKYHQAAKSPPPYPSCPFSDAKIWQFATQKAQSGAFIWNVSR